jgi:hypothetical protein
MKHFLYAVQTEEGRELWSATLEVVRVGDVQAYTRDGDLVVEHEQHRVFKLDSAPATMFLLRWPADDKLAEPVRHRVKSFE